MSAALCGLQESTTQSLSNPALSTSKMKFDEVFKKFPEVLDSTYDSSTPPKHGIRHTIPTEGSPVFARPRRLFGDKLQVAKEEFDKMMKLGIIRPSN